MYCIGNSEDRITLTSDEIHLLEQQDRDTLAKWWCMLNRYEWPDELYSVSFDPATDKVAERWSIMSWIMCKISHRECLREWNKDNIAEDYFDEWYDGIFKPIIKAGELK